MPKVIRPRQEFPTPLFKLLLPLLLVAPFALWSLTSFSHGAQEAVIVLATTAAFSPLVLFARGRIALAGAVLSAAMLGLIVAEVIVLFLHPPE
ncbi:MAG: hypothetical protein QOH95_2599 [Gaiellaceae bacterium]|jgi:hypothetical protein|nr:hypothetical protein [Gaiellaceae bacterium]